MVNEQMFITCGDDGYALFCQRGNRSISFAIFSLNPSYQWEQRNSQKITSCYPSEPIKAKRDRPILVFIIYLRKAVALLIDPRKF
jgi:hypothetical protein